MTSSQQIIQAGLATYAADFDLTLSAIDTGEKQVQFRSDDGQKFRGLNDIIFKMKNGLDGVEHKKYIDKVEGNGDKDTYYICKLCNKCYNSEETLSQHDCERKNKEVKAMFEYGECTIPFPSINRLASHMMVHEQKVEHQDSSEYLSKIGFTCNVCDKVICSKGNLVKHQLVHMGIKLYKCSKCDKQFSLKGNRDKHEMIHTDTKTHECQICLRKFSLKGNLQQHILTHSTFKLFHCYLCDKEFTLKGNLDKHIKRHANGLNVSQSVPKAQADRKRTAGIEHLDESAEAEEMTDSVKGISIVNVETTTHIKQEHIETDDAEISDVQNL